MSATLEVCNICFKPIDRQAKPQIFAVDEFGMPVHYHCLLAMANDSVYSKGKN